MVSNTGLVSESVGGFQCHHHQHHPYGRQGSFISQGTTWSSESRDTSPLVAPLSIGSVGSQGSSPVMMAAADVSPPASPLPSFQCCKMSCCVPVVTTYTYKIPLSMPNPASTLPGTAQIYHPLSETSSDRSTPRDAKYIIRVQFKWGRQDVFLTDRSLVFGCHVLVTADRGVDIGMVVECRGASLLECGKKYFQEFLDVAGEESIKKWRELAKEEKIVKRLAQKVLAKAGVVMKVVHAEYQFDRKKITLHYSSQISHPDFRIVLDTLFSLLRVRIWFSRYTNGDLDSKNKQILAGKPELLEGIKLPTTPEDDDDENCGVSNTALAAAWKKAKRNSKNRKNSHFGAKKN